MLSIHRFWLRKYAPKILAFSLSIPIKSMSYTFRNHYILYRRKGIICLLCCIRSELLPGVIYAYVT